MLPPNAKQRQDRPAQKMLNNLSAQKCCKTKSKNLTGESCSARLNFSAPDAIIHMVSPGGGTILEHFRTQIGLVL